jgi:hypothetical protein
MTIESVNATEGNAGRRLRLGMVGGGEGAFIGSPNRLNSKATNRQSCESIQRARELAVVLATSRPMPTIWRNT